MANQWFRLYAEFATDPKVQMLSEVMQRRFVMLLCMRCNGDVTLHDEEVTFQLRISGDDWQATKALFIAKGFIDEANNILHWDKRQFRSNSSAERVARHRNKVKQECNVTATPPDTEQNTDTDKKEDNPNGLSKKVHQTRGTRLQRDWELPQDWGEWAYAQGLSEKEIDNETDKFRDWWLSKAGAGGTKVDWEATWRNWIRKYLEQNHGIQTKNYKQSGGR